MTLIAAESGSGPAEEPGQEGLSVWIDQSADRCVLRLRGRLCAETVEQLDQHVDVLLCKWCDDVVVDLNRLGEMDQVGARLVVGFGHYVEARGGQFSTVGATPDVAARIEAARIELSSC